MTTPAPAAVTLNVATDKPAYNVGDTITVTVTYSDANTTTSTMTITVTGTDGAGGVPMTAVCTDVLVPSLLVSV